MKRIQIVRLATILLVVFFLSCNFAANAQSRITLTLNGASTQQEYLLPYCFMQNVIVEQLWSGGGGGGGARVSGIGNQRAGAGGGASGSYISNANFGNPTSDISISIGYGGAYGTGNQGGSGGGNTLVQSGLNYVLAKGGNGGNGANGNSRTNGGTVPNSPREGNISYGGNNGNAGANGSTNAIPYETRGGFGGDAPPTGIGGTGGSRGVTGTSGYPACGSDGGNGGYPGGGGGGAAAYTTGSAGTAEAKGGKGGDGRVKLSFDFVIPDVTVNKNNAAFCQGGNDIIYINSNTCNGATYKWYKNDTEIYGQTDAYLDVSETGTYYVVVTLSYNTAADLATALNVPATSVSGTFPVSSSKTSANITVTVNPLPEVSGQNLEVCNGSSININPAEDLTYSYNGITDAYLISLENIISTQTLIVTPKNASGCEGEPFELNIVVDPLPVISNKEINICNGESVDVNFENEDYLPQGTIFKWELEEEKENVYASNEFDGKDSINFNVINLTLTEQTVTYKVTAEVCGIPTIFDVLVNVKPEPPTISNMQVVRNKEKKFLKLSWNKDINAVEYILTVIDGLDEVVFSAKITNENLPYFIYGEFDFSENPHTFEVITDYGCAQSAPFTKIISDNYSTTSDDSPFFEAANIKIWTNNGELYIKSNQEQEVTIWSVIGVKVETLELNPEKTARIVLPKGIYILQNNKTAVKIIL